jgi:cell division protein FtsZ
MPLGEIEDAIGMIEGEADDNADIIWGNVIKGGMDDEIKVTVIATGFDSAIQSKMPQPRIMEAQVAANGGSSIQFHAEHGTAEEDLDVPTFIRRQAD